jgi:hypothetical protein
LSNFGHVAQGIKYIFFILVLGNGGQAKLPKEKWYLKVDIFKADGMIVDVRVMDMSFTERPTSHSRQERWNQAG